MVAIARPTTQTYSDGSYLRQRLILATLSTRPVRFNNIRTDTQTPGLSPSEISFIRLLDKLTTGTNIHINETGTSLFYKPGYLLGGSLSHECHPSRSTPYYLQPLLLLAPFCKHPLKLTLHGPTHAPSDPSIDTLSAVTIPLLRRLFLGVTLNPSLDIRRRALVGTANGSGRAGLVSFSCDILTAKVPPVDLLAPGFVKRVRGLAMANRTSPTLVARLVDGVRGGMNRFLPDVYVHTDVNNGKDCGVGFGLQLAAESTEGCLIGADWCAYKAGVAPEEVARDVCNMLLEEVCDGGCVDSGHVWLAVGACAVAGGGISRVRVGRLSEGAVEFLRDLERFLGIVFKVKVIEGKSENEVEVEVEEEEEEDEEIAGGGIVLSCVGIGLANTARQRF